MIDESGEFTVFHCRDDETKTFHKKAVEPILANEFSLFLEEKGVKIVSAEEFLQRTLLENISQLQDGSTEDPSCRFYPEREYRTYYKSKEFNALPANHPAILRLTVLAQAMHDAGVCDIPVRKQNFNSIDVRYSDDLLQQFLCISNSESLFGAENIGMGGRGPWGIHPMHNQKAGTMAYANGTKFKLKKNGICYPGQAIVRDSNGAEIKQNSKYFDPKVILDNARCALIMYQTPGSNGGLAPWGTGDKWGSNRHCSKKERDRLKFSKYLGTLSCCSQACKDQIQETI